MYRASLFVAALFGGATTALAQVDQWVDADGAPAPPRVSQAPVYDDMSQVTPAWQAELLRNAQNAGVTSGWDQYENSGYEQPDHGPLVYKNGDAAENFGGWNVESLLTEPLYFAEHGDVWTRVHDGKASFGADGFTAYPAFARESGRSYPVEFDLSSVTVGGVEMNRAPVATVSRDGHEVTIDHGTVREVYHVDLDQIEQTFVFDRLPAAGELVVTVDVDTDLTPTVDGAGIHFSHPEYGAISYGDAFVVDAAGERISISREWNGDAIELTVPASFVANATLPLTIDPPITFFTSTAGTPDDTDPDLCFVGSTNIYWAVFEDYFDGTQEDVYAVSFNTSGTVVDFITIEFGTDDWNDPKIAYHVGSDRCLAVASEFAAGAGSGSIKGRLVDCNTGTTIGSEFYISSIGAAKVHPDVGGNNWNSTVNSHFCVVWSSRWNPGTYEQIQYRIVNWDGTMVTGLTSVTNSGEVHIEPAISETHGDGDLFGDWWTATWIDDANADGFGSVMARRIVWSGVTTLGAGNFTVASGTNCKHPVVTSRFNRDLLFVADRPSIVAFERDFPSNGTYPPPRQRSIYATVVSDGAAYSENPVSWQLEDFDLELEQREPAIACDGNCFYLIYNEIYYGNPGGSDFDMYMVSGCISDRLNDAELALAERHENMAFSASAERNGAVATIWDGEENSISDDGMALWQDENVANGGTLEGATLEIPTTNQSIVRAVGRQYCDANPNSGGGQFGRQSTWCWVLGDQSLGSSHFIFANDMPFNTFGYALAATAPTNVNMPAGAIGRLCVSGAGRYVDQVGNSGTTGSISTTMNPLSIPQPTGFVSASAGETWYVQYWHRDLDSGGNPTSNFSSACRFQFTN